MAENNQPRPDDAVQGTQSPQPLNALVLGGIEGLNQRLANTKGKQKIAALKEALKYGQEGLELLTHALQDKDWQVSHASYGLLQENVEPELKQALQKYDPYLMCFQIFSWCSRGFVHSIAFSPDGSTLASGSDDTTIKLWDINSGEVKNTLTGHSDSVSSIAFSPDGSTLASCSHDNTIKLWKSANLNLSKQEPVKLFHCYTALKEVLKSGQVGLDQVIDALDSESWEVHEAAYALLLTREDPRSQQALQNYTRCTLNSEVNLDYTRLRFLLARQRWKEAEAETEDIMLQISGQNRGADVNSILSPCTFWDDLDIKTELKCSIPNADLHTIYDLWREYSNAHSDSFSQQTLSLNFWMMVKTKLEEIFKEQQRIKSNYGVDRMSAEYGEAMRNRD